MSTTPPSASQTTKAPITITGPKTVILRDYSKGIFFYPLAIYSFIACIIEYVHELSINTTIAALAVIWIAIFFANLFVISFDFSTGKVIVLMLVIVAIVLVIVLLFVTGTIDMPNISGQDIEDALNPGLTAQFYLFVGIAISIIILFVIIQARFHYVKIEQNEIYLIGILGEAKRFPTATLRIEKEIADWFEFLALRAGTMTLFVEGEKPIVLRTVPMVDLRQKQIDDILSTIRTKIE